MSVSRCSGRVDRYEMCTVFCSGTQLWNQWCEVQQQVQGQQCWRDGGYPLGAIDHREMLDFADKFGHILRGSPYMDIGLSLTQSRNHGPMVPSHDKRNTLVTKETMTDINGIVHIAIDEKFWTKLVKVSPAKVLHSPAKPAMGMVPSHGKSALGIVPSSPDRSASPDLVILPDRLILGCKRHLPSKVISLGCDYAVLRLHPKHNVLKRSKSEACLCDVKSTLTDDLNQLESAKSMSTVGCCSTQGPISMTEHDTHDGPNQSVTPEQATHEEYADNVCAQITDFKEYAGTGEDGEVTNTSSKQIKALNVDVKHLAAALTSLYKKYIWSIPTVELLKIATGGTSDSCRQVHKLECFAKTIRNKISSEVIRRKASEDRTKVLGHFIHVSEMCLKSGDLNSCITVLQGLQHPAVARLATSWQLLAQTSPELYRTFSELVNASDDHVAMLRLCQRSDTCAIPWIPHFLAEMLFAHRNQTFNKGHFRRFIGNHDSLNSSIMTPRSPITLKRRPTICRDKPSLNVDYIDADSDSSSDSDSDDCGLDDDVFDDFIGSIPCQNDKENDEVKSLSDDSSTLDKLFRYFSRSAKQEKKSDDEATDNKLPNGIDSNPTKKPSADDDLTSTKEQPESIVQPVVGSQNESFRRKSLQIQKDNRTPETEEATDLRARFNMYAKKHNLPKCNQNDELKSMMNHAMQDMKEKLQLSIEQSIEDKRRATELATLKTPATNSKRPQLNKSRHRRIKRKVIKTVSMNSKELDFVSEAVDYLTQIQIMSGLIQSKCDVNAKLFFQSRDGLTDNELVQKSFKVEPNVKPKKKRKLSFKSLKRKK